MRRLQTKQLSWWSVALVLAVVTLLVSYIGYQSDVYAICKDCISRTYFATIWWQQPKFYQTISWLPLHSIVYGSALHLGGSPLATAHTLTALCSSAMILTAGVLAYEVTKKNMAAMLAALLMALSPMRLWMGFSMLSEPMFSLLFILFLWTTIRWWRGGERNWMLGSVLLCLVMTIGRFIAWPVAALLGAALVYRRRNLFTVGLALGLMIFPAIWLFTVWLTFGDPFYAFKWYAQDSIDHYGNNQPSNLFAPKAFLLFFSMVAVFLPAGLLLLRRSAPAVWRFALASLALVLAQFYFVWNQLPTTFPERSVFLSGSVGLVAVAMIVNQLWSVAAPKYRLGLGLLVVVLLAFNGFAVGKIEPKYDVQAARMGAKLATLPNWSSQQNWAVGYDLRKVPAMTLDLVSGRPFQFVNVDIDLQTGALRAQGATKLPRIFVLRSQELAALVSRLWQGSVVKRVHGFYVVTGDPELQAVVATW